jgi:antitoxin FitA
MASITIRNLDEATKKRLRLRAASKNRSMEEEVRQILREVLTNGAAPEGDLAEAIGARFRAVGGVTLELPPRTRGRRPPAFA